MECCFGVSLETALQLAEFYTVENGERILKKTDVSDCNPSSECMAVSVDYSL